MCLQSTVNSLESLSITGLKRKFTEITGNTAIADNVWSNTEYCKVISNYASDRGIILPSARERILWLVVVSYLVDKTSNKRLLVKKTESKLSRKERRAKYLQDRKIEKERAIARGRVRKSTYKASEYKPGIPTHPFGHTRKSTNGKQGYNPELSLSDLEFSLDTNQKYGSTRTSKTLNNKAREISRIDLQLKPIDSDRNKFFIWYESSIGQIINLGTFIIFSGNSSNRCDNLPIEIRLNTDSLMDNNLQYEADLIESKIVAIYHRLKRSRDRSFDTSVKTAITDTVISTHKVVAKLDRRSLYQDRLSDK